MWNGQQLNPNGIVSPLSPQRIWYPSVRVVPGSEQVYGPDQRPGPHYGYRIQYTRVSSSAGVIGLNEYKINYDDIPNAAVADQKDPNKNDPRVHLGYIEFNSTWDSASRPNLAPNLEEPALANQEDPANGVYRPHSLPTLKFDPATSQNVLADPVQVSFNFQMNKPNDVIKIDYLTRELISVALETRLYDQARGRPQSVNLTEKVQVRNLQR